MKTIRHGTHAGYTHGGCWCADCKSAMSTYQKAWRAKNRERILARDRSYYEANRESRKADSLARWKAQKPAILEQKRQKYAEQRVEILAKVAAYQASKPTSRRLSRAKRRAILRATDRRLVTAKDWRRLCARYDNRCAYCKAGALLTMDHIIPLIGGGRHAIGNLIPACGSCNSSKNSRLLVEWVGRS